MKTKHVKPRSEGETGQIMKLEAPIHHSQVQPVTKDGAPSRVAKKCALQITPAFATSLRHTPAPALLLV